mgnify:CR=1 FL=1
MTRKHFVMLARVLGQNKISENSPLVSDLAYELKKENRFFNVAIFKEAIKNNIKKGGL